MRMSADCRHRVLVDLKKFKSPLNKSWQSERWKWDYSRKSDASDWVETPVMKHCLVCHLLEELCTMEDLARATD